MRVLITRPATDAAAATDALVAAGYDVAAFPLLTIERVDGVKINLSGAQAFIVSDAEGARALADTVGVRTFPVFAESSTAAAAARACGFSDVTAAAGDASDLARLIQSRCTPEFGALIYVCSTGAAINLSAMLNTMGFSVRSTPLYSMNRVATLPAELAEDIKSARIGAGAFYSPDEARAFVALALRAGLEAPCRQMIAVVTAPVVAAPLTAIKFARVITAADLNVDAVATALTAAIAAEAKAKQDKADQERAEAAVRAKAEAERVEGERAEAERTAAGRAAAERRAAEEQQARERAEADARAAAKREQEAAAARARAEAERAATEEQQARERAEADARAAAKREQEAAAARAKAEAERAATERRAAEEQQARDRAESDARAAAKREQDAATARTKAKAERRAVEEQQDRERAEADARAAAIREQDAAAAARAKAEAERRAAEEQQARERAVADARASVTREQDAAAARAKAETERRAAEEQQARERAEADASAAAKREQDAAAAAARAKAEAERAAAEAERQACKIAERDAKQKAKEAARAAKELVRVAAQEEKRLARESRAAARLAAAVTSPAAPSLLSSIKSWIRGRQTPAPNEPARAETSLPMDAPAIAGPLESVPSETPGFAARPSTLEPSIEPIPDPPPPIASVVAPPPEVTFMSVSPDQPADVEKPLPANLELQKPMPRTTARAARLMAEDAADQRLLTQRYRSVGRGEELGEPASEAPDSSTPAEHDRAAQDPPARRRVGVFLAIVVILAGAILAGAPWWTPRVRDLAGTVLPSIFAPAPPSPLELRVAEAEAAAKALTSRINALEQKPVPPSVAPAALTALETRFTALEQAQSQAQAHVAATKNDTGLAQAGNEALIGQAQLLTALTARIATLESAIGNVAKLGELGKSVETLTAKSADASQVLALSERLAALETSRRDVAADRAGAAAVVLATAQLRAALGAGRPFSVELEAVKILASRMGIAFESSGFEAYAARGVPSLESMREGFSSAATAVVRADRLTLASESWLRRTLERVMSIATIRPVGDVAGNSTAAIVARAEHRLSRGDLAAAIEEMAALDGPAQSPADGWLREAKARVAADAALTALSAKAVAALGQAATP